MSTNLPESIYRFPGETGDSSTITSQANAVYEEAGGVLDAVVNHELTFSADQVIEAAWATISACELLLRRYADDLVIKAFDRVKAQISTKGE